MIGKYRKLKPAQGDSAPSFDQQDVDAGVSEVLTHLRQANPNYLGDGVEIGGPDSRFRSIPVVGPQLSLNFNQK